MKLKKMNAKLLFMLIIILSLSLGIYIFNAKYPQVVFGITSILKSSAETSPKETKTLPFKLVSVNVDSVKNKLDYKPVPRQQKE